MTALTLSTTTTVLRPFFRDHPGEPVPEENFWTLWCKRRLTEADTLTIQLGATPFRLTSAHLHHPLYFLRAGYPSYRPTNSVKALKAQTLSTVQKYRYYFVVCYRDDKHMSTDHAMSMHEHFVIIMPHRSTTYVVRRYDLLLQTG